MLSNWSKFPPSAILYNLCVAAAATALIVIFEWSIFTWLGALLLMVVDVEEVKNDDNS